MTPAAAAPTAQTTAHAPAPPARRRTGRCALAIAAVALAALVLRLPSLTESLWYDEAMRTGLVLGSARAWRFIWGDVHNPLYNLLMAGWIRLFGDAEVVIRLPSLLAGVAAILLVARWAAPRLGALPAWGFAAWALLHPVHVWYSTEAKNNMLAALFAALVLIAHARLDEAPARGRVLAAAAASGLAIWTDFITLLVIAPVWLVLAIGAARPVPKPGAASRRSRAVALAWAVGLTLAAAAPLLALKAAQVHELFRPYLRHLNIREVLLLVAGYFVHGHTILPGDRGRLWTAAVAAPFILVLLILGWRRLDRTPGGPLVNAAFGLPLVAYTLLSYIIADAIGGSRHYIYQERNLLVLLIPFGLVLWSGVAALPRRALRATAAAALLGVAALGSTLMATIHADVRTVMEPNPDWRSVGAYLQQAGQAAGAPPVVLSRTYLEPLRYYHEQATLITLGGRPLDLGPALRAIEPGRPLFALSDARWWPFDEDDLARLDARFERQPAATFGHITLERLTPRPTPPGAQGP